VPEPHGVMTLATGAVHVWKIDLDVLADAHERLWTFLSDGERERARRFHLARDGTRFVVAHAAVRLILARYLPETPAASLLFSAGPFGKPELGGPAAGQLQFNISHSGAVGLCAVARTPVGVDVERIREDLAFDDIAASHFSPDENVALRGLPPEQRVAAFFSGWTRKEAYIKAHGDGLALPLTSFDVALAPDQPAALVATRPDPGEARRWSLSSLEVGPGYAAAVAVEDECRCLRRWRWSMLPARVGG